MNILGRFYDNLSGTNRKEENEGMKVIVGLGNPGLNYTQTKHNVGFRVIDRLGEAYHIPVKKFRHKAFIGDGTIAGHKVMLVKPQTYMNLSGESIREIVKFYKVSLSDLIIIFDDTSLPLSATRIRLKGSAGGHNGMKNIIALLGSDQISRIKVGIGEKPNGWDLADYVLAKFTKDEEPLIEQGIDRACEAVKLILTKGVQEAMNKTN